MNILTWGGYLGPFLAPVMLFAVLVFVAAGVTALFSPLFASQSRSFRPGATAAGMAPHGVQATLLSVMRLATWLFLACIAVQLSGGYLFEEMLDKGIWGALALRFAPVWAALGVTFALSLYLKRRLGLYGKLFDSPIGMIGLALVLFWVFTAFFAGAFDLIATHDPLAQSALMKRMPPGTPYAKLFGEPDPAAGAYYLLGGDNLGRDVFSRVIAGSIKVMLIAPFATGFAFSVGIVLGLPAAYYAGALDTVLSFLANLVLAFPVILLFYLLVTPEIAMTRLPVIMAAVLFTFPMVFLTLLWNARFRAHTLRRVAYIMVSLAVGGWLFMAIALQADPLGLIEVPPNLLIVFVSVVFVNSPNIFRIVRGLALDIKTRDYVIAAQTRGEGAWYIMLWEILPNARGSLLVDFCLRIGYVTILLGTLGFFGLGLDPESPDWGKMIIDGRHLLAAKILHISISAAIPLLTLVLGLNLLADGLREESLRD